MSSPTRPLLPSFFLNIVYPFLEDFPCLMRWSWRRRARARRTRACVVRQCGVLVFAFAEFIFGGPFLLCSAGRVLTARSSEEGFRICADAEFFRRQEGVACEWRERWSGSAAAQRISPSATRPSRDLKHSRLPSALRPTLARGVPLSVEFQ